LSEAATQLFEKTRERTRSFLNAKETAEIIFTTGTTMGINLVAQSYGRAFLKAGDEILELLQTLNRDHGKTIVMVTHDPRAAERANRTLHLEKGTLAEAVPDTKDS
jgi:selenocysteine lyase/cysteine desulfurase